MSFSCVEMCCLFVCFFFFKQKTAYEILTCDWSSDVCSSDPQADLSDENTETESVCATVTNSNTPTSELSEREVRDYVYCIFDI